MPTKRFVNPQCTSEFIYELDDMLQRDNTKTAFEVRFRTTANDNFQGSFDEDAFDDANQEWLRGIEGVKTVDSADDIDDALARSINLPALFTIYDGGRSAGRDVPQVREQRIEPRLSVICVAKSLRSKRDGRVGALRLMRLVKNRICGEEV